MQKSRVGVACGHGPQCSRRPDDPVAIDEALALSLVILGPAAPHSGKGVTKSIATDAVSETLMRCRSSQRHGRNTLLFIAADEASLGTAREVIAKAMAWASIIKDDRLKQQMTKAQAADAADKAKTHSDGARRALRTAWSHIFCPTKSETPGKPIDLEHSLISARDRAAIPVVVYEKAKGATGSRWRSSAPIVSGTRSSRSGRRANRICGLPKSPTGLPPMSTCRSCATM